MGALLLCDSENRLATPTNAVMMTRSMTHNNYVGGNGVHIFLSYHKPMTAIHPPVGDLLRVWRQRRRMSQLDLACEAEVSTRHLSFVETGRSVPSREMVLHLAERMEIPLRERNTLLVAAGYAPVYPEKPLADPAYSAARKAIDRILEGHEPYPALAIDRHWNLVASNSAVMRLLVGVSAELLQPPLNVLRLSLHPSGIAPRIANFLQWRSHLLTRLRHQIETTADPILMDLLKELQEYPAPEGVPGTPGIGGEFAGIIVPLQLITDSGILSLLSTTTVFGTPVDVTLAEIALESFFPADADSAAILRQGSAQGV